jgi:hypothetical protein
VSDLIKALAAWVKGAELAPHLTVAPEGHVGLAENVEESTIEAPQIGISDIIQEVQEYSKGKRC